MPLTRRRFLEISAAAVGTAGRVSAEETQVWRGQALGAEASMRLAGISAAVARPVFRAVALEVRRLERIFSIHLPQSQLRQLNRAQMINAPAPELVEVLTLCDMLHSRTGGAFDPTLQPVWRAYSKSLETPDPTELNRAYDLIGWQDVHIEADRVRLQRPGMALTLNGIAQGYITDRIAALLRARGLRDVLIDMGEVVALGNRPSGRPWSAGIAAPAGELLRRVSLTDRAIATSAPRATILNLANEIGHIFHPQRKPVLNSLVSVSAPAAAVADGLSTAACLLDAKGIATAVAGFAGARVEVVA